MGVIRILNAATPVPEGISAYAAQVTQGMAMSVLVSLPWALVPGSNKLERVERELMDEC